MDLDKYNGAINKCIELYQAAARSPAYECRKTADKLQKTIADLLTDDPPLTIEVTPLNGSKKLRLPRVSPDPDKFPDEDGQRSYAQINGAKGYILLTPRTCRRLERRRVLQRGVIQFEKLQKVKIITMPTERHYRNVIDDAQKTAEYAEEIIKKHDSVSGSKMNAITDSENYAQIALGKTCTAKDATMPEIETVKRTFYEELNQNSYRSRNHA